MDDISEKIQSLLNDEESMKQIKELAEMFSGNSPDSTEANAPDLSSIASMLSGNKGDNNDNSEADDKLNIDVEAIMKIGQIINNSNKSDNNTKLLIALRPLVAEDKQQKIDKAIKYLRLLSIMTALKEAGIINKFDEFL